MITSGGTTMKRVALRMVAVIVALSICLAPVAWAAEKDNDDNLASNAGLGVASFICSVPYGAIKVAVAILGGVIGGVTYVLSGFDKRTAGAGLVTTSEGEHNVSPGPLPGEKKIHFPRVSPRETRERAVAR